MKASALRRGDSDVLAMVLGLADGILNALTLGAAAILHGESTVTVGLALRIAVAACVTAGFVMFVAQYAEYREQLLRAGRHLSLGQDRQLVTTRLGRDVLRDTWRATVLASTSSFPGALVPLLAAAILPGPAWLAVPIALAALTALGVGVSLAIDASPLTWGATLFLGGLVVTAIGYQLRIA